MKTYVRYLLIAICLFASAAISASAQSTQSAQATPNWKQAFKTRAFYESSAVYWAGAISDYLSSRGKREGSPALRNDHGAISGGKYFALNGGLYGLTVLLHKVYPKESDARILNWTRRILGAVRFGVAFRNSRR
jgi:hypothetical protein